MSNPKGAHHDSSEDYPFQPKQAYDPLANEGDIPPVTVERSGPTGAEAGREIDLGGDPSRNSFQSGAETNNDRPDATRKPSQNTINPSYQRDIIGDKK